MNILVDQSGYALTNMGDLAMLQVAVSRLLSYYSESTLKVFTTAPELLQNQVFSAVPIPVEGRAIWSSPVFNRIYYKLSRYPATYSLTDLEWQWRNHYPKSAVALMQHKWSQNQTRIQHLEQLIDTVQSSDLVIATGGGYLTDAFSAHAFGTLNILELAHCLGKPTALVGQGLGPINDPLLYQRAKTVLPKIDLLTLREKYSGLPLCRQLGIDPQRVIVTGDDAIELAYTHRPDMLGGGIGVNLRIAYYSKIDNSVVAQVRDVLQQASQKYSAPLLPLPIAHSEGESDPDAINQLLHCLTPNSDGGKELNDPIKVIRQAGKCRVTVTGSYHAGVFSLSQGVPVIGLAKSEYYRNKFAGLAEQFGLGCQTILLDDVDFANQLTCAIDAAWENSPDWRSGILSAAFDQIRLSHHAYEKIAQLS